MAAVPNSPRLYPALDLTWPPAAADVTALHERLAASLHALDVTAVQEFDSSWRAFFSSSPARDRAAGILVAAFSDVGLDVSPCDIADEDWARRSQANLQPVAAGRFIVAPPWSDIASGDAAKGIVIRILPSMGFGTGHHATTRLCLTTLGTLDVAGRSFLDVGTGSGVLAIAASLLGASPVVAIDADPDAVSSARDNLQLNGLADLVRLVEADFRVGPPFRARTVAANLTGAALVHGCADLAALVEPGGTLLVSGFTVDESEWVLSALSRAGEPMTRSTEEGWCAASFRIFQQAGRRDV